MKSVGTDKASVGSQSDERNDSKTDGDSDKKNGKNGRVHYSDLLLNVMKNIRS